jgi:two-component system, NarL family, response regulator
MSTDAPIRILLVDDHSILRMGLATLLSAEPGLKLVAEAENAEQAVAAHAKHSPDVTLMDARMPGGSGVAALKRIRSASPQARVIMFTTYDLHETLLGAMDAGASGYVLKSTRFDELVKAIRQVHAGGRWWPAQLEAILAAHREDKRLTPREAEILDYLRRGLVNREIGVALGITEATVKIHLRAILEKLGVADRTEAVAVAYERGLLRVGDS